MANNLISYIFLGIVVVFIFLVNSINLKKNRAIHARAIMLNLKSKREGTPDSVSEEDVANAVANYDAAAELFNDSISSGAGAILNVILRYPKFEKVSDQN